MATKARPELEDLTSGFEELPAVTSRPIDVFVTPAQVPTHPAINELITSLEKINPSLSRFKQAEYETFTKEQEAKAEEEFNKTKTGIKKAVKSGEIPAGASPEFINKWVSLDLKRKARNFKTGLWAEYDAQNIAEHPDPDAFNIFFEKYSADFRAKHKLDGYNPVNISEGFLPNTMSAYAELNSQHINGRVAIIETKAKEDLGNEIFDIGKEGVLGSVNPINDYFGEQGYEKSPRNKRIIYIAENIYKEAQIMIDAGLDTAEAQKVIRNSVANLALEFEDEKLLRIFEHIPTRDGGMMSGTQSVEVLITETKKKITELRMTRLSQEETLIAMEDKKNTKAIVNGLTAHIDNVGIENLDQKALNEFFRKGIVREDGETVPIDIHKRDQLTTMFRNYKNATELLEEDDETINDFYIAIMANPNDPNIKKDLIDALGTDINDTTFKAINTFHDQAVLNDGHVLLKSQEWKQLELDLDEIVGSYASGTVEKAKAITALKQLRIEANDTLTNQPDITKKDFIKAMEFEADSILIRLLGKNKLKKITDARDAIGMEGTLLQSLKKITETLSEADRIAVLNLLKEQDEIFFEYNSEFSTTTQDEFNEKMNEINNQIMEIHTKYAD